MSIVEKLLDEVSFGEMSLNEMPPTQTSWKPKNETMKKKLPNFPHEFKSNFFFTDKFLFYSLL